MWREVLDGVATFGDDDPIVAAVRGDRCGHVATAQFSERFAFPLVALTAVDVCSGEPGLHQRFGHDPPGRFQA